MRRNFIGLGLIVMSFLGRNNPLLADNQEPTETAIFHSELSAEATVLAVRSSFSSSLDQFLEASKLKNNDALILASKSLASVFYHEIFHDIVIPHQIRRDLSDEMAGHLEKRFLESQNFLSPDHVSILETAISELQVRCLELRKGASHRWPHSWVYGSTVYTGMETSYHTVKFLGRFLSKLRLDFRDYRQSKLNGEPKTWGAIRAKIKRPRYERDAKLGQFCKRALIVLSSGVRDHWKKTGFFGLRVIGGGFLAGFPIYYGYLKDEEPYAIADKVVERRLKPALELYKRVVLRGVQ